MASNGTVRLLLVFHILGRGLVILLQEFLLRQRLPGVSGLDCLFFVVSGRGRTLRVVARSQFLRVVDRDRPGGVFPPRQLCASSLRRPFLVAERREARCHRDASVGSNELSSEAVVDDAEDGLVVVAGSPQDVHFRETQRRNGRRRLEESRAG